MVWSTQAVDKITVPASVPIGPGQDGVILSGADIPVELKNYGITACIIFQRGAFPSVGTTPEVKYYFMALNSSGGYGGMLSIGAVVADKLGGLGVFPLIDLPSTFHNMQGGVLQGNHANIQNMDVNQFAGIWKANNYYRLTVGNTDNSTGSGWTDLALAAGFNARTEAGYYSGLQWFPTIGGMACIRGTITNTVTGGTVLTLPTAIAGFKCRPNNNVLVLQRCNGTSFGMVDMVLDSNGVLGIGGLSSITLNSALWIYFTYPVTPF